MVDNLINVLVLILILYNDLFEGIPFYNIMIIYQALLCPHDVVASFYGMKYLFKLDCHSSELRL